MADIFPTHWQYNPWYIHWLSNTWSDVLLESPIVNEAGQAEVGTGLQRFYTRVRDMAESNYDDGDSGVPSKKWFYGAYSAELNSEFPYDGDDFGGFEGLGYDDYGRTRGAASGYYDSHKSYWWQHDYFVYSGVITSDQTHYEAGTWLPGAWYTAANGGFDGRWVQLFDDRPGVEPSTPLSLTMSYPTDRCSESFSVTARATGGQSPYTFVWRNATPISPPDSPSNIAEVYVDKGQRDVCALSELLLCSGGAG